MGVALHVSTVAAKEEAELRHLRVCDTSACYTVWNVVDSDGDGVGDADEITAGFDPFDADDRPPLDVLVELIAAELLPTFELGVGQIVVFPAELQAKLESIEGDSFGAFPSSDRRDAMKRLGMDPDLLAEHGLDTEFGGFSLTIGKDTGGDGPPKIIGGVEVSLISGEGAEQGEEVLYTTYYDDGRVEDVHLANGDVIHHDGEGNNTRTGPGGNVKSTGYVNPDADDGAPTQESFEAWTRLLDATIRTVAGWSKFEGDPDDIEDAHKTIILIDPEYTEFQSQISDPPQVGTAQPETRPDLFNPLLPGAGCAPGC
jgi:hypothetical protein